MGEFSLRGEKKGLHLEICTDGSLHKGIASYGEHKRSITRNCVGSYVQLYRQAPKRENPTNTKNGNTKIEMKQAIERREAKGLTTKFLHEVEQSLRIPLLQEIARQRGEDKLFSYREYKKREKRSSQESQEEHHMSTPRGQFVSFLADDLTSCKNLSVEAFVVSYPLTLIFSTRGQLPTPNGLKDTTPPKLACIYLCKDVQKDCHTPPSTSIHIYPFCFYFFLGLPTGLQSPKLSVGQQWLSNP
ncbi:hypothetical protein PROFUN_15818 [Planoprotostelium fungivorum]|uniref:Uncharacterized protein n=1 Tax=Planoprotostelium fungivorum TaxID=1890364 RepID=A0A2P6MUC4_9EUKA|nr:hypothetical protein PROFUN_15818 [Planoprotostelium fungivorum]